MCICILHLELGWCHYWHTVRYDNIALHSERSFVDNSKMQKYFNGLKLVLLRMPDCSCNVPLRYGLRQNIKAESEELASKMQFGNDDHASLFSVTHGLQLPATIKSIGTMTSLSRVFSCQR